MIIVFGSINSDLSLNVDHIPAPGETVLAADYNISGGGKGANQAFASARTGIKTALVGCVGDDMLGHKLLNTLRQNEVMTSGVTKRDTPTGMASITVLPSGENAIVVAAGANNEISNEQVPDEILTAKNILLAQNESPAEELLTLLKRAHEQPVKTIFNFAPFHKETLEALSYLDLLIINEIEAEQTAQALNIEEQGKTPELIAQNLASKYDMDVIITLGENGSLAVTKAGEKIITPALALEEVIDTTGAGDAYCGTLAAALHEGATLEDAMRKASCASSLACTKKGALDSFPYLGDIEEALTMLAPSEKTKI